MKNILKLTFLFTLLLAFTTDSYAQKKRGKKKKEKVENTDKKKKTDKIEVRLNDGTRLIGSLERIDQDSLVIVNEKLGRIALSSDEVKKYDFIKEDDMGEYLDESQYDKSLYQTRYWFSPTALPVGKGNRYYSNINLFFNNFSFGITDNFSISAGFESLSLFAGRIPVVFVAPKFSVPVADNVHIGVGTTLFIATNDGDFGAGGIAYGNATIGSATTNFTAGLGYAYSSDGDLTDPVLELGGAIPISKKVSIMAEAFTPLDFDGGIFNFGVRIVTRGNMSFDVGVIRPFASGNDFSFGLPLFAFSTPL